MTGKVDAKLIARVRKLIDARCDCLDAIDWDDIDALATALEAARAGEWLPIESAPEEWRDGRRLLLGWKYDNPALAPHFELGWFSGAAWRNTYGHPFSGDPDFLLCPRPLPAPPAEEKKT